MKDRYGIPIVAGDYVAYTSSKEIDIGHIKSTGSSTLVCTNINGVDTRCIPRRVISLEPRSSL